MGFDEEAAEPASQPVSFVFRQAQDERGGAPWLRSFRLHQIDRAGAEAARQLEERHDRRVAAAVFELADILLAEAGALGELLLGQARRSAETQGIATDELAHVHAGSDGPAGCGSLATIVCEERARPTSLR